jgi:hypothetical protein
MRFESVTIAVDEKALCNTSPSPPAETTTRQDQAGQSRTTMGPGTKAIA